VAIVLTTHLDADIERCARLVFLARGGRVVFDGALATALGHLDATRVSELYERMEQQQPAAAAAEAAPGPVAASLGPAPRRPRAASPTDGEGRRIGVVRQTLLLTRRSAAVMTHNRLTLAVLLGSPLLVTAMMATLFGNRSFADGEPGASGAVQTTFWLAFAAFFFGLTYGLLQVVVERPVLARERFAGLSVTAYLLSKVLVLTPLLVAVTGVLLGTLRLLDRLPAVGWTTMAALGATMLLVSLAALALGLLASAAVRDAAQATLALPMLCFPQVLFAGAVVPVVDMTGPGRLFSAVLANRWGFEALGRTFGLSHLRAAAPYGAAFSGSTVSCWVVLVVATVTASSLTGWIIHRTTPRPAA
jgi:hypothetical protein